MASAPRPPPNFGLPRLWLCANVRRVSQIAAALARKKGKKVDPVPSQESVVPAIHSSVPPMPARPADAAPPKKSARLFIFAGAGLVALLVIGWLVFSPAPPPPTPARPAAPATAAKPPAPAASAPVAKPAATPVALPAEKSAAPTVAHMAPEIEDQLRKLTITARRTGKGARIVVGGKVFEPGDTVIPGVLLDAVHADRVVFRNAENQRFERRF